MFISHKQNIIAVPVLESHIHIHTRTHASTHSCTHTHYHMLIAQLKDDNVISNNMMHLGNKLPLTFSSYCFLIQVTYRFTVSTESKQCLHQANKISHTHTHTSTTLI